MSTAQAAGRILGQLEAVRLRCPELRFGQLIATIGNLAEDETGHSLWDVEDADFAAALERFAQDMARRAEPSAAPDRGGVKATPESTSPPPPRQVS